jgi:hypothetical protein
VLQDADKGRPEAKNVGCMGKPSKALTSRCTKLNAVTDDTTWLARANVEYFIALRGTG